ncbi:aldehyde dehydrogenase (NAD+) [Streptomyces sp. 846.5]|nr:aldehyde dehydrogenase family protein [Streptomyces sp. 846.5]TDT97895.1 aldehyde dehydrogenase (NAD+) [Streptomyces sp. 846.5]
MTTTTQNESRTSQSEPAAEVVGRLRATFNTGVTRPLDWRIDQLQRLRALLVENEQELLGALWADLRKNAAEAKMAEIDLTVGHIDETLASLESWLQPRPVEVPAFLGSTTTAYTKYDPLGVVLVIGTWNFPVHLLIDPLIGALAAGNTVVAKPSEISVHTSAVLARLLRQYFDADVLTVVEGGAEETTALLAQRFGHIFYTGNGRVGRIVMAAAAENLTPVTLELGGKNPIFVAPDADVDEAAKRLAGGKFSVNAGQSCGAPDYVLADPATAVALVSALRKAIEAQFGSTPQTAPDYGRIINERHFDRLTRLLDSGQVAVGGQRDRDDLFIAPTVLTDVDPASPVMQEEIFGPILAIIEVADLDAAIAFINERDKPLGLYALTTSEATKSRLVNETSSGAVALGSPGIQVLVPGLPFGGVGESGMGHYHGRYSLETFSHLKSVVDVPLS